MYTYTILILRDVIKNAINLEYLLFNISFYMFQLLTVTSLLCQLQDLDLDAFAEELERQGFGNKSITLYDIRAELNHKYKDLRTAYRPPNAEEVFNMLTKEIPETFYIGLYINILYIALLQSLVDH